MRKLTHILALCILILASSCERRPLMDVSNTHYVRVYVDEDLLNVTKGFYNEEYNRPIYESPDVLRITLADPETGHARAERFLRNKGRDDRGLYYDGYIIADPGSYTLMAYNFDTESTIIDQANNHTDAKAYTNEIASHLKTKIPSRISKAPGDDPEQIVYDPDHLFAANCGELYIPYSEVLDTLRTPEGDHFLAQSIVKSYYLQVRIKGMEYVSSSVGLLTGMAGSTWLHTGQMDIGHNVTVYFEMLSADSPASGIRKLSDADQESEAIIYTTFNTFGKIPDEQNELEITFDFLTVYGEPYSETFNITDIFYTPEAIDHQWLLLDHVITIPDPPPGSESNGGGFTPSVDRWEDIESDITI